MIDIVSVNNMRSSEKVMMEHETSSIELMYRASLVLFKSYSWKGKIKIVVGKGNNGGDGYALACLLAQNKLMPMIYKVEDPTSEESSYFASKASSLGVMIKPYQSDKNLLENSDIIVDCLLGTGFQGEVKENYRKAIEEINNKKDAYIISCDINSGISGDYGPSSVFVKSDLTICIQAIKKGLLIQAKNHLKEIAVGDIGVSLLEEENHLLDEKEKLSLDKNLLQENDFFYAENGSHKLYVVPKWLKVTTLSYK